MCIFAPFAWKSIFAYLLYIIRTYFPLYLVWSCSSTYISTSTSLFICSIACGSGTLGVVDGGCGGWFLGAGASSSQGLVGSTLNMVVSMMLTSTTTALSLIWLCISIFIRLRRAS